MIRNFTYLIIFTSAPGVLPEQNERYWIQPWKVNEIKAYKNGHLWSSLAPFLGYLRICVHPGFCRILNNFRMKNFLIQSVFFAVFKWMYFPKKITIWRKYTVKSSPSFSSANLWDSGWDPNGALVLLTCVSSKIEYVSGSDIKIFVRRRRFPYFNLQLSIGRRPTAKNTIPKDVRIYQKTFWKRKNILAFTSSVMARMERRKKRISKDSTENPHGNSSKSLPELIIPTYISFSFLLRFHCVHNVFSTN